VVDQHRPSVDSVTGELLNNEVVGASATIEVLLLSTIAVVSLQYRVREGMKTGLLTIDDTPWFQRRPGSHMKATATGVYLLDIVDGLDLSKGKQYRNFPNDEHGFGYLRPRL
jgi:hypothetical protein